MNVWKIPIYKLNLLVKGVDFVLSVDALDLSTFTSEALHLFKHDPTTPQPTDVMSYSIVLARYLTPTGLPRGSASMFAEAWQLSNAVVLKIARKEYMRLLHTIPMFLRFEVEVRKHFLEFDNFQFTHPMLPLEINNAWLKVVRRIVTNAAKALSLYKKSISETPDFPCASCHMLCYSSQMLLLDTNEYQDRI